MSISLQRMEEIIRQAREAAWVEGRGNYMFGPAPKYFSERVYEVTLEALMKAENPPNYPAYACPECMKWIPAEHLEHDDSAKKGEKG